MATYRTSLSRGHLLQAMQVKSGMEICMCTRTHARTHTHTHIHVNFACVNKSKALCGMVSYVQEHDHNVVYMCVAGGTGIR